MSSQTDALALLDVATFENPSIPWGLNWQDTIKRMRSLVLHPELLHQRALNVCGPAIFFRMWFARDPLGAATFGFRLLRSGSASIGPLTVAPSPALMSQDYVGLRATADATTPSSMPETADWMLVSALRDSENSLIDYLGQPHTFQDRLAGMTLPSTVATWLQATNAYSTVVNTTNSVFSASRESLEALGPSPATDVALLMNAGFLELFPAPSGAPSSADSLRFPDHYVQLLGPATLDAAPGWVKLSVWTFGRNEMDKWASEAKFLSNYFGTIVASVSQ